MENDYGQSLPVSSDRIILGVVGLRLVQEMMWL